MISQLSGVEQLFIAETMRALLNGSKIGKKHYSTTLSRLHLECLVKDLEDYKLDFTGSVFPLHS